MEEGIREALSKECEGGTVSEMRETWLKIFTFIGIVSTAGIGALIMTFFTTWLKDKIEEARRNQIMKHRFDGKPIAKCWCRDCRMHNNRSGSCSLPGIGRYTPDNGFCYEADPIWKSEDME